MGLGTVSGRGASDWMKTQEGCLLDFRMRAPLYGDMSAWLTQEPA